MASLGSSIPVDCPICTDAVDIPMQEIAREGTVLTVTIDVGVLGQHIATAHSRAGATV